MPSYMPPQQPQYYGPYTPTTGQDPMTGQTVQSQFQSTAQPVGIKPKPAGTGGYAQPRPNPTGGQGQGGTPTWQVPQTGQGVTGGGMPSGGNFSTIPGTHSSSSMSMQMDPMTMQAFGSGGIGPRPNPMPIPNLSMAPTQFAMPEISSGIHSGPVKSPAEMDQLAGMFSQGANARFHPTGNSDYDRMFQDNLNNVSEKQALDFSRSADLVNAGQLLDSQRARSGDLAGLLGSAVGEQGQALQQKQFQTNTLANMMRQMMPLAGMQMG